MATETNARMTAPVSQVLSEIVASLTDNGRNPANCLSIHHDDLRRLVADARAALAKEQGR